MVLLKNVQLRKNIVGHTWYLCTINKKKFNNSHFDIVNDAKKVIDDNTLMGVMNDRLEKWVESNPNDDFVFEGEKNQFYQVHVEKIDKLPENAEKIEP